MDQAELKELADNYANILKPILDKLRLGFNDAVNENNISRFLDAIAELNNARCLINSAEKIGIRISYGRYIIATFELSGDPVLDFDQAAVDLPKPD